jgi:hypothetical protein
MKMNFKFVMIAFMIMCINLQASEHLDWQDRPEMLNLKIESCFSELSNRTSGHWNFNGKVHYTIAGVEEEKLAHHLIISQPNQKDFYFLDMGAGDFQWGTHLANYINERKDIAEREMKVHIIGIRGEQSLEPEVSVNGKCIIYKLGSFKIEELETAFKTRGYQLQNKMDLIISSWTFRHLVDPVGTLVQAYNHLKPGIGLFLFDGFFCGYHSQKDPLGGMTPYLNMAMLLLDTKAPFLIDPDDGTRALNNFILKRNSEESLKLPLHYDNYTYIGSNSQVNSGAMTIFKRTKPEPNIYSFEFIPSMQTYNKLCGDQDLFNYFQDNKLFSFMGRKYNGPLREK